MLVLGVRERTSDPNKRYATVFDAKPEFQSRMSWFMKSKNIMKENLQREWLLLIKMFVSALTTIHNYCTLLAQFGPLMMTMMVTVL